MPNQVNNNPNIRPVGPSTAERIKRGISTGVEKSFADVLQTEQTKQTTEALSFSSHAQDRIQERNIALSIDDHIRLQAGVDKVREKGGQESLVLMDNNAFVVSVKNQTVITAVDSSSLRDNVFTNIDSAIVV